jgi:hypothetical protein
MLFLGAEQQQRQQPVSECHARHISARPKPDYSQPIRTRPGRLLGRATGALRTPAATNTWRIGQERRADTGVASGPRDPTPATPGGIPSSTERADLSRSSSSACAPETHNARGPAGTGFWRARRTRPGSPRPESAGFGAKSDWSASCPIVWQVAGHAAIGVNPHKMPRELPGCLGAVRTLSGGRSVKKLRERLAGGTPVGWNAGELKGQNTAPPADVGGGGHRNGRWGEPSVERRGRGGPQLKLRSALSLPATTSHDVKRQCDAGQNEERKLLHVHRASFHRLETLRSLAAQGLFATRGAVYRSGRQRAAPTLPVSVTTCAGDRPDPSPCWPPRSPRWSPARGPRVPRGPRRYWGSWPPPAGGRPTNRRPQSGGSAV